VWLKQQSALFASMKSWVETLVPPKKKKETQNFKWIYEPWKFETDLTFDDIKDFFYCCNSFEVILLKGTF
jgi:hypothetical protein